MPVNRVVKVGGASCSLAVFVKAIILSPAFNGSRAVTTTGGYSINFERLTSPDSADVAMVVTNEPSAWYLLSSTPFLGL